MNFQNSVLANQKVLNARAIETDGIFSLKGVQNKLFASLGVTTLTAILTMIFVYQSIGGSFSAITLSTLSNFGVLLVISIVLTIGLGIYNAFHMTRPNPITIVLYCGLEGILVGMLSITFEALYPGIVFQALIGTAGITWVSAILSKRLTDSSKSKINKIIMVALPAYILFAVINFVISLITHVSIYNTGFGIIVSLIAIALGAIMLVNDFDNVSRMNGLAPTNMEWSAAYAITLDIIWIFLELLRLLANTQRR